MNPISMKGVALFVSLLILISCKKYKPPEVEVCASAQTNSDILICSDPRLPDNQRDYDRNISLGDICTNGADYDKLKSYCGDLRVKLIECESR